MAEAVVNPNNIITPDSPAQEVEEVEEVKKKSVFQKIKETIKLQGEIADLKKKWKSVLINCQTFNFEEDTFELFEVHKKPYGYFSLIDRPAGLVMADLENITSYIEEYFPCLFQMEYEKMDKYIKAEIITKVPEENYIFCPDFTSVKGYERKLKPWEIYIGNKFTGSPIIKNMGSSPHVLGTGITGSGKSQLLNIILTTLIYNCSPSELGLYMIQVDKNDLSIYEDCEQVRYFAESLEQAYTVILYLYEMITQRNKTLRPYAKSFKAFNYLEYNALKSVKTPMSTVYLVVDEFSGLMPRNDGNADLKKLRNAIIYYLEEVIRLGRSVGVNVILATQRPTADMISPFLKSQVNNIITFKQINDISSRVCIDTDDAVKLKKQEAIVKSFTKDYMKTPFISPEIIEGYLRPSIKPSVRKITLRVDEEVEKFYDSTKDKKSVSKNKQNSNKGQNNNSTNNSNNEQNQNNNSAQRNEAMKEIKQGVIEIRKFLQDQKQEKGLNNEPMEFNKVPSGKVEELIQHNISKIPNFVEYKPLPSNVKIIDEKDLLKEKKEDNKNSTANKENNTTQTPSLSSILFKKGSDK